MPSTQRESPPAPISLLLFSAPPPDSPSVRRIAAAVAALHGALLAALVWTASVLPNADLPVGPNSPPAGLDADFTMLLIGSGDLSPAPKPHPARTHTARVRAQPVAPKAPAPVAAEPRLLGTPTVLMPPPPAVIPTTIPEPTTVARVFDTSPPAPPRLEPVPPRGAEPGAHSTSSGGGANGNGNGNGSAGTAGNGAGGELSLDELAREPRFTPFTQAPELMNRAEVKAFLQRRYPPSMSARGLGGRAVLWLLIDREGGIRKAVMLRSSGSAVLDDAAMESIDRMEFRPAINQGKRVNVWVQLPVSFRPDW
jgi:protein TonB